MFGLNNIKAGSLLETTDINNNNNNNNNNKKILAILKRYIKKYERHDVPITDSNYKNYYYCIYLNTRELLIMYENNVGIVWLGKSNIGLESVREL